MKKVLTFSLIAIMTISLIVFISGIVNEVEKEEVNSWRTDRQQVSLWCVK